MTSGLQAGHRVARRALAMTGLMLLLPFKAFAEPRFVACPSQNVQVAASSVKDRATACDGARAALAFFASAGMSRANPIMIEVVRKLPKAAGATAIGAFVHESRRIFVLDYAQFALRGRWLRVPIERASHRSVVVHEVAHHLTLGNNGWPDMSWHGKEYVAYVTMFATMDPRLRQRILAAVPGGGFETAAHITPLSLAFDPEEFAVDAYRHYLKPGNGNDFLRSVVEGRALTE